MLHEIVVKNFKQMKIFKVLDGCQRDTLWQRHKVNTSYKMALRMASQITNAWRARQHLLTQTEFSMTVFTTL